MRITDVPASWYRRKLKIIERSVLLLSRASIPGLSGKVYSLVELQERVYSIYQEVSVFSRI